MRVTTNTDRFMELRHRVWQFCGEDTARMLDRCIREQKREARGEALFMVSFGAMVAAGLGAYLWWPLVVAVLP